MQLWIDVPGVGFSTGDVPAPASIGRKLATFLDKWYDVGLISSRIPLFIGGEHFALDLASTLLDHRFQMKHKRPKLHGIILSNPDLEPATNFELFVDSAETNPFNLTLLDARTISKMRRETYRCTQLIDACNKAASNTIRANLICSDASDVCAREVEGRSLSERGLHLKYGGLH